MSNTPEILFDYLSNIYFFTPQAPLDLDKLDKDYVEIGEGMMLLEQALVACNDYATALSRGDLDVETPAVSNEIAAALKGLHASLNHITWQSKQVAEGDYSQRVDFMGEFANAFNKMVDQLHERSEKLKEEIEQSKKHAEAMEHGQILLRNLMQRIPQQIFVISEEKYEVLFQNEEASSQVERESGYVKRLLESFPEFSNGRQNEVEVRLVCENEDIYLFVNSYPIEWGQEAAVVLSISDISAEKKQMKDLESHAFFDALTGLHNRHYGMMTFNEWVDKKKAFSLVFIDLDRLKFVNDEYGHEEGDNYIIKVANYLSSHIHDSVVCRLGGDEFMVLMPDVGFDEAKSCLDNVSALISSDEYLIDKNYTYSISFGIVEVKEDNALASAVILRIADERMYEHKKARKKSREN